MSTRTCKNEFSDNKINKSNQLFLRGGDIYIILRGEGGAVLKEINVSASLREGHTVVEEINNSIPYGCGKVVGLDKGINRLLHLTTITIILILMNIIPLLLAL